MNSNIVEVKEKTVYGRITYYPANDTAELFTHLTGRKTLLLSDLSAIEALGYKIQTVCDSVHKHKGNFAP